MSIGYSLFGCVNIVRVTFISFWRWISEFLLEGSPGHGTDSGNVARFPASYNTGVAVSTNVPRVARWVAVDETEPAWDSYSSFRRLSTLNLGLTTVLCMVFRFVRMTFRCLTFPILLPFHILPAGRWFNDNTLARRSEGRGFDTR